MRACSLRVAVVGRVVIAIFLVAAVFVFVGFFSNKETCSYQSMTVRVGGFCMHYAHVQNGTPFDPWKVRWPPVMSSHRKFLLAYVVAAQRAVHLFFARTSSEQTALGTRPPKQSGQFVFLVQVITLRWAEAV